MNLKRCFLTENNCYKSGKRHTVKGIMVHSTGANNPYLKRYVQPDDGLLGKNAYNNAWNQPTPGGRQVCVHGFIGKLADGSVATYQTLPWDMVGWHSGSGSKGSSQNANNNGYVGFEICEDGLTDSTYFQKVYTEAVELCAHLCKEYGLTPKTDIICHSEGHAMGIASNHGDVLHWFPKHGKNMDTFRADVAAKLGTSEGKPSVLAYAVGNGNEQTVFNFCREVMKLNVAAACGILANINAESGFRPTVYGDNGTSYGICQWHNTRFTNLKNWCAANGKDYTTLDGQLWYLKYELEKSYKAVLTVLQTVPNTAQGAYEAGYAWCKRFEIPADTENASIRRGNVAKSTYWSKYSTASPVTPSQKPSTLAVGDVVTFMGQVHYSSANSSKGVSCRPGKAKITSIYSTGKHPYHLIREAGGTSNVYGWVDASDIYESVEAAPSAEEPTDPKEVETVSRISEFVAFLESRVGHSIYVWGAQGEKNITEAWIARREDDDQSDINRVLALWNKLKAKGITDIQAFDCSGLVMFWVQNTKGYIKSDMTASGLCSTCKSITKAELKAGDLVFHHNGTKVSHVGVYVGDGNVIHCKGRDYGVIKESLSKYSWNRFGRLAVLQQGDVTPSQPVVPVTTVRDLKLASPMMEGADVKALQAKLIALGYDLGSAGADGKYGSKTDVAVRLFQTRAKSMTVGICNASMRTTLNL